MGKPVVILWTAFIQNLKMFRITQILSWVSVSIRKEETLEEVHTRILQIVCMQAEEQKIISNRDMKIKVLEKIMGNQVAISSKTLVILKEWSVVLLVENLMGKQMEVIRELIIYNLTLPARKEVLSIIYRARCIDWLLQVFN